MDKSEFDELDRAVQSLVGDSGQPNSVGDTTDAGATNQPQPRSPFTPAQASRDTTPATDKSEQLSTADSESDNKTSEDQAPKVSEQPDATDITATIPKPAAAPRPPRGRFMDIVPPRKPNVSAPSKTTSRTGVSIAPINQSSTSQPEPSQPESAPIEDQPAAEPIDNQLNTDTQQSQASESLEPVAVDASGTNEPLDQPAKEDQVVDMANQLSVSETGVSEQNKTDELVNTDLQPDTTDQSEQLESTDTNTSNQAEDLSDLVDLDEDEPDSDPENSPFINGAQVEKRPLGKDAIAEQTAVQNAADSVESIEQEPDTTQTVSTEAPVMTEQAEQPSQPEQKKPFERSSMSGGKVKKAPELSNGPTSISQQYTVESSAAEDQPANNNSSMYDTANYSQPLAHPAKKKSGWLGVFWIVLLLAIGGGAAFIAYQLRLF